MSLSHRETVLLTGGTGFLGSRLARRLADAGYDVLVAKRSTSSMARLNPVLTKVRTFDLDNTNLAEIFARGTISMVLHCATDYGRKQVPASTIIDANLVLPLRLLELAVDHGTPIFINTDTILDKGVNHYSLSKRQFAEWLQSFSKEITAVNVSLEHFFGPDDDPTKFVSLMVSYLLGSAESIALTEGRQLRDFIHVDDVVEAFILLIGHCRGLKCGYSRYEVGSGKTISIRDFMLLLQRLSGNTKTRLDFGALPYREHEVMESKVDITPLKALGWTPRIVLEEGLRDVITAERSRLAAR